MKTICNYGHEMSKAKDHWKFNNRMYCKTCAAISRDRKYKENLKSGLCGCGRERDTKLQRCLVCRNIGSETAKKVWQQVLNHYGRLCACCGEKREEFLTLDHKLNNGSKERKAFGTTLQILRRIIKSDFPLDYQILCYNCNCCRGARGYCPHDRERADL